ncbi:granulocyte-macrophage colony-stimulating factor receptor subunit alpha-like isoform X2 [Eleutherodactylus coqui]|uniref:granulocyte-macrophage colony-stimulating factor receptor subunit alpha-like isoform X2 n=1 Tax=Eleutherodactylus coqui TaxID=57060 RepID=UPI0034618953
MVHPFCLAFLICVLFPLKTVCSEDKTNEGKNNSAAENFACVIYNVSIMNCSWTVGKEAPEDTQYSLVLRQNLGNIFVECQDYRKDSFGRQVGCVLKRPNISFNLKVYVAVLGFSNETSIQFFDKVYKAIQDVILDPPRNITLTYNSDELEIKWQKPETYDDMPENSFRYNIIIKDKVTKDICGSKENVYKTSEYHPNERVTVAMRAKWDQKYSHYSEWSAWSKPITGGNSPPLTSHDILIVLGVVTAIILIVLIFLCYRFKIWMKLFPQIPKPSMKLFEQVEQKEKSVSILSETEIISMKKDEEELICSYVTEMPEKLKT